MSFRRTHGYLVRATICGICGRHPTLDGAFNGLVEVIATMPFHKQLSLAYSRPRRPPGITMRLDERLWTALDRRDERGRVGPSQPIQKRTAASCMCATCCRHFHSLASDIVWRTRTGTRSLATTIFCTTEWARFDPFLSKRLRVLTAPHRTLLIYVIGDQCRSPFWLHWPLGWVVGAFGDRMRDGPSDSYSPSPPGAQYNNPHGTFFVSDASAPFAQADGAPISTGARRKWRPATPKGWRRRTTPILRRRRAKFRVRHRPPRRCQPRRKELWNPGYQPDHRQPRKGAVGGTTVQGRSVPLQSTADTIFYGLTTQAGWGNRTTSAAWIQHQQPHHHRHSHSDGLYRHTSKPTQQRAHRTIASRFRTRRPQGDSYRRRGRSSQPRRSLSTGATRPP